MRTALLHFLPCPSQSNFGLQIPLILKNKRTQAFLRSNGKLKILLDLLSVQQAMMILSLPAMQQRHVLTKLPAGMTMKPHTTGHQPCRRSIWN